MYSVLKARTFLFQTGCASEWSWIFFITISAQPTAYPAPFQQWQNVLEWFFTCFDTVSFHRRPTSKWCSDTSIFVLFSGFFAMLAPTIVYHWVNYIIQHHLKSNIPFQILRSKDMQLNMGLTNEYTDSIYEVFSGTTKGM